MSDNNDGVFESSDKEVVTMKKSEAPGTHGVEYPINPKLAMLIAVAIALFAPIIITPTPHLSIRAMTWILDILWDRVDLSYSFYQWFSSFPLTGPRLIFVHQAYRYYERKSTRTTTVLVGLVTELPMCFVALIMIATGFWSTISIPTPFMTLFAIVLMWKWSYSEPKAPW